jgi:hypothetical protein
MLCAECHRMLAFARPPRAPRRVVATVPGMALGPASLRVPFGPRAGEPVSSTRLALIESTPSPGLHLCMTMIMVAAALLVVLSLVTVRP